MDYEEMEKRLNKNNFKSKARDFSNALASDEYSFNFHAINEFVSDFLDDLMGKELESVDLEVKAGGKYSKILVDKKHYREPYELDDLSDDLREEFPYWELGNKIQFGYDFQDWIKDKIHDLTKKLEEIVLEEEREIIANEGR